MLEQGRPRWHALFKEPRPVVYMQRYLLGNLDMLKVHVHVHETRFTAQNICLSHSTKDPGNVSMHALASALRLHGCALAMCVYFTENTGFDSCTLQRRIWKQGKGKFSQGKGETKTCHDSSIGSCVRASVTEARVTVYVCVHMRRECVCERKDVHAYCSKMLAAQHKKTTPWLNWRSDSTTLRKSKKKTSNIGMIWLFRWATRLAWRQGRDAALPNRC